MIKILSIIVLLSCALPAAFGKDPAPLKTESIPGDGVWVDPVIGTFSGDDFRVTVWFEEQFLGDGAAYLRRSGEFENIGRTEMRRQVLETLKSLSRKSRGSASESLDHLVESKQISELDYHWIVNGFSCRIDRGGIDALKTVPAVRMIYFAGPAMDRNKLRIPLAIAAAKPDTMEHQAFTAGQFESPWYVAALKADRVWKEHKITGKGVLNVIHDGNFVLSPGILPNRYTNPREKPNGKDDSGNGLVDDLHGFDFLLNRSQLTRSPLPKAGEVSTRLLHGHQCVAIICNRGSKQSPQQFGLAPDSKWAGVLANQRIEAAIEWSIEQGADTYSMSFSRPKLGESRSHWRKMMEHGAYCGVHFVSGAGNFAVEGSPQFAPIPVQMRVPEDIPNVVFAAAGVKQDLSRTPFSSQGPVEWNTQHYKDGRVDKPEVSAFNYKLPLLMPNGRVVPKASSGNSFAGPMFCGTIALVLSANPELKPWEVRDIIIRTATDVGAEGYDYQTGHGLINAFEAVSEAIKRVRKR
jgi:hypothetical protein